MSVSPSQIIEGLSVSYEEVFGKSSTEKLFVQYNEKDYLVDDQYCMNPGGNCNAVFLTFIEIDNAKEYQDEAFGINFKTKKQ